MAKAETDVQADVQTTELDAGGFASLLQKEFKPKSDKAKEAVEGAVQTLAEHVLADTSLVSDDVLRSIESYSNDPRKL